MVTRKITVAELDGLHLRPAGKIADVSLQYMCKCYIKKGDQIANAKSVLGLLAARIQQGDEIEIICDGKDEVEAISEIVKAIQEGLRLQGG